MNSFSNYTNFSSDLKNSSIFYWYGLKKNFNYKSNNIIVGCFKDSVIKKKIYYSSNGLKQNYILDRKQIANNLDYNEAEIEQKRVFPENRYFFNYETQDMESFVGYFKAINDLTLRFNLFTVKYFKNILIAQRKQQQIFSTYKKFLLIRKNKNNKIIHHVFITPKFKNASDFLKKKDNNLFIKKDTYTRIKYTCKKFLGKKYKDWIYRRKFSPYSNNHGLIKVYPYKIIPKKFWGWKKKQRKLKWYASSKFYLALKFCKSFLYFLSQNYFWQNRSKNFLINLIVYKSRWKYFIKYLKPQLEQRLVVYYKYSKKKKRSIRRVSKFRIRKHNIALFFFKKKLEPITNKILIWMKHFYYTLYLKNESYFLKNIVIYFLSLNIPRLYSNYKFSYKKNLIKILEKVSMLNDLKLLCIKYNFVSINFFNNIFLSDFINKYYILKYKFIFNFINEKIFNFPFYNKFINFNSFSTHKALILKIKAWKLLRYYRFYLRKLPILSKLKKYKKAKIKNIYLLLKKRRKKTVKLKWMSNYFIKEYRLRYKSSRIYKKIKKDYFDKKLRLVTASDKTFKRIKKAYRLVWFKRKIKKIKLLKYKKRKLFFKNKNKKKRKKIKKKIKILIKTLS